MELPEGAVESLSLYSMMLAAIEEKSRVRQQVILCTRVKELLGGRPNTENQMWLSVRSLRALVQNKCEKSTKSSLVAVGIILSIC